MKRNLTIILFLFIFLALKGCSEDVIIVLPPPSGMHTFDYEPSWAPDGHTIAYFHCDTVASQCGIYLIDTSGFNKRLLVNGVFAEEPDFSPDGNWITFQAAQIYKIKINGDSLTQLTYGEESGYFPSWSYDGKYIIFDHSSGYIWKMRFDGYDLRSICLCGRMPSWSLNGRKIVLQSYVSGNLPPEVYIMDSSGQNLVRVTFNNNWDMYPRFSPDGQKIIFTQKHETSVNCQIYTININGTGLKKLTDTQGYTADYSPDGQKIVYCDSSPNSGRLWIMNKDGTNKKQLTFP